MKINGNSSTGTGSQAAAELMKSAEMMNDLTKDILEKKTEMSQKLLKLGVASRLSAGDIGSQIDIRG